MQTLLQRLGARMKRSLWPAIVPTIVMLALALSLTGVTNADTTAAAAADAQAIAQTPPGTPVCESCHEETGVIWEESTHAGTGTVTCESCHGEYKEGHPKAETMLLPMESETCHSCHQGVFAEWEASEHGDRGLDCYDCHQAHTQGLRLSSQNELCAACHSDEQTRLAHSVHGISGIACDACHMTPVSTQTANGTEMVSDHTFSVASDVCARCHSDSIHSVTSVDQGTAESPKADEVALAIELNSQRISELETELNAAEARNTDLRNIAVIGMGLTLGVGGLFGLIIGIAGAALLTRRKQS